MSSQKSSMKNGSSSSKKSSPSKSPAGIKTIERVLSWVSGNSDKSKDHDAPPSPADPQSIVGAIITQYIKSVPPKSESATKNKPEVQRELEKRKDKVRDKLRSGFDKNKVVAGDHVNELCSKLDRELTAVINAYVKSITEVANKTARDVISTILPKGKIRRYLCYHYCCYYYCYYYCYYCYHYCCYYYYCHYRYRYHHHFYLSSHLLKDTV